MKVRTCVASIAVQAEPSNSVPGQLSGVQRTNNDAKKADWRNKGSRTSSASETHSLKRVKGRHIAGNKTMKRTALAINTNKFSPISRLVVVVV